MSPRPANRRSADNSVAPCRSSSVIVGLPVEVPQPCPAAGAGRSPGDSLAASARSQARVGRPDQDPPALLAAQHLVGGRALIAFRSTVLSVRLQPWQRRCRSAAAPTPPCCALSLSYRSSRSAGISAATSTRRAPALADCSPSSASAASLAAVTVASSVSTWSRSRSPRPARPGRSRAAPSRRERPLPGRTACAAATDLGLQVLQLARRADQAAVEPLAVSLDPGAHLLHVGLCLGLLALEVAVLRGQRGDRVAQLAVPGLEPGQLACSGSPRRRCSILPSSASMSASSSSRSCASGDAFTWPR